MSSAPERTRAPGLAERTRPSDAVVAPLPQQADSQTLSPASITVVIPCRNGAATLGDQLQRLQREQPPVPTEVIVADNGSTDATRAVAAAFSSGRVPVRVVEAGARPGINHARNAGVLAGTGELILCCDCDDMIAPGWLAAMWEAAHAGAHLVGGALVRVEADGRLAAVQSDSLLDYLRFLPWPAGANCGFTRAAYDVVGGFDESYRGGGDETDFFWRAQLAGFRLAFVPDAKIRYVARPTLRSRWRQQRAYGRSHVALYAAFREHGMPRSELRDAARFWCKLPQQAAAALAHPEQRPQLVSRLAQRVGRLQACAALRVWYP